METRFIKICASALALAASICFAEWSGTTSEPTSTKIDEKKFYEITTPEELAWFAEKVNAGDTAANAILKSDIELSLDLKWTPIGQDSLHGFDGTFDGNSHTISKLYVSGPLYAGLFGFIDYGNIKNLTIDNSQVEAQFSKIGSYAYAYAGTFAGKSMHGALENCINKGNVTQPNDASTANTGSYLFIGGLVGKGGIAINCTNEGDVTAEKFSKTSYVGGISGQGASRNEGADSICINKGTIKGLMNVGGIIGKGSDGYWSRVIDSKNFGKVQGEDAAGGIVGSTAYIYNSENEGEIVAKHFAGGIAGYDANIESSVNKGTVTAESDKDTVFAGGICGIIDLTSFNTSNYGNVNAIGKNYAIAGGIFGSSELCPYTQNLLANYGTVSASSTDKEAYAGGIAGRSLASLSDVFNQGKIASTHFAAGIAALMTQNSLHITSAYVATPQIEAPKAAGIVYYSSVTDSVSNVYLDKTLQPELDAIVENLGKTSNIHYVTTEELQQDSIAYSLNQTSVTNYNIFKDWRWSRESGYPIFADSAYAPIRKITFIAANDTFYRYTDYTGKATRPTIGKWGERTFIGWYAPSSYFELKDSITANFFYDKDQTITGLFTKDESLVQTEMNSCLLEYIDQYNKMVEKCNEYGMLLNGTAPNKATTQLLLDYCKDDDGNGILNMYDEGDVSNKTYNLYLAQTKTCEEQIERLKTTTSLNAFTKFSAEFSVSAGTRSIRIQNAPVNSAYAVFDMQGRILANGTVQSADFEIATANPGNYLVRIGSQVKHSKSVK